MMTVPARPAHYSGYFKCRGIPSLTQKAYGTCNIESGPLEAVLHFLRHLSVVFVTSSRVQRMHSI